MSDQLEKARRDMAAAKEALRAAEKAEREAMAKNEGAPARILALCQDLAGDTDPRTRELVALVQPIASRLHAALKGRCRGQCGGYTCNHDDAAERIAGVR